MDADVMLRLRTSQRGAGIAYRAGKSDTPSLARGSETRCNQSQNRHPVTRRRTHSYSCGSAEAVHGLQSLWRHVRKSLLCSLRTGTYQSGIRQGPTSSAIA
jgi:hypothetical protein